MNRATEIVCIGGSAGALALLPQLLDGLPEPFGFALVIVLHRMRNAHSDLGVMLGAQLPGRTLIEPDDKDPVLTNTIYLAPQNYHLLVDGHHFSLDYSEAVLYSRPSIDVSFDSIAQTYKANATGILLTGANADGAAGLLTIKGQGGKTLVQDPATAAYPTMPQAALEMDDTIPVYTPDEIKKFLARPS